MPNLLLKAAKSLAKKPAEEDHGMDFDLDDEDEDTREGSTRQRLETAIMEFEKARTPSEKVDAMKAFIELAGA